jgi:transposase
MQQLYPIPGCVVDRVSAEAEGGTVLRVRIAGDRASCPSCHTVSRAPHSTYLRRPADLPSLGRCVRLEVIVRRFYWAEPACARRTFAERLPGLLNVRARRTRRLAAAQRAIAIEVGAEAGARLAVQLAMPVSADSLLRLIRRAPLPTRQTPQVLGVDDWALRRGATYGTILVDLEARHVVDLLPDRTAATIDAWLRRHPAVRVIARDRSTEYTRAATEAAPHAIQVADRWHLLRNVREMAERWLTSVHPRLRRLPPLPTASPSDLGTPSATDVRRGLARRDRAYPKMTAEREHSAASAAQRRAIYDDVRRRHLAGEPIMRISRALGIAHGTVRKYAAAEEFPARAPHRRQRSILDPYLAHLTRRHADGCENALQLWREIRDLGYPGTTTQVRRWLQGRRQQAAPTTPHQYRREGALRDAQESTVRDAVARCVESPVSAAASLPSPTQLAWLLVRPPDQLPDSDARTLQHLMQDGEAVSVVQLVQQFAALLRDRTAALQVTHTAFDAWLDEALTCGIRAVETFARGLAKDGMAVRAALTMPWSNGQTEGQVTKLKLLKRQMYGRASFDLLRRRVLFAA